MSVLPLKADMRQREWHVRLVPLAEIDLTMDRGRLTTLRDSKFGDSWGDARFMRRFATSRPLGPVVWLSHRDSRLAGLHSDRASPISIRDIE